MIFCKTNFLGGENTLSPPAIECKTIFSIQVFDGTYNQIYLSVDTSMTVNNLSDDWNINTKMNATFEDDLDAGNSGFSLKNTDEVVIKRREYGDMQWTVIYVKDIKEREDFDIHFIDKYARAGIEYQYCISSYINGIENSFIVKNVFSDFDGFYIADKDSIYGTIYDVDGCDTSRNMAAQTRSLLNSKHMDVASYSPQNCDSGSVSGTFARLDSYDKYDNISSLNYRNNFKDRLARANKQPLILKIDDGRIWMIKVSAAPSDSQGGHRDIRQISFSWVEIGDVNDMRTLFKKGLSDVDQRWW